MINNKTVIIVGAGASKDLDMPLGNELQHRVSSLLSMENSPVYPQFCGAVSKIIQDENQAHQVLSKSRALALPLATAASVDNFLDQHKFDEDFVSIVKLAIAYEIALAEQRSKIGGNLSPLEIVNKSDGYFMNNLFNLIVRGHQERNLEVSLENLKFVIFNYDRCVERVFSAWLEMRFGNNAHHMLIQEHFIHVYGSLGNYFSPGGSDTFLHEGNFAFLNPGLELPQFADKIKVFTEQEDSEVSERITRAIHEASTLIFLGFGFEEQNMRFFIKNSKGGPGFKKLFATMFGFSDQNVSHLDNLLSNKFSGGQSVGVTKGTAQKLFEDYQFPISSAIGSLADQ